MRDSTYRFHGLYVLASGNLDMWGMTMTGSVMPHRSQRLCLPRPLEIRGGPGVLSAPRDPGWGGMFLPWVILS